MSDSKNTNDVNGEALHLRAIRSYVIRGGRLTGSQQTALETLWPHYGLEISAGKIDQKKIFGRKAPLVLEIGFGMGDSLLQMALQNPHKDFVGIEVHRPGVGRLLHEIGENQITNLRIYCHDAKEILRDCIEDQTLDCVQIFFPDPWHKKKHNKRRLIQSSFIDALRPKLKISGAIHMATDWVPYAEHMMEVMSHAAHFSNAAGANHFSINTDRPLTKFEKRGQRLGHAVNDLVFIRDA